MDIQLIALKALPVALVVFILAGRLPSRFLLIRIGVRTLDACTIISATAIFGIDAVQKTAFGAAGALFLGDAIGVLTTVAYAVRQFKLRNHWHWN
jgi:hypothetical protein